MVVGQSMAATARMGPRMTASIGMGMPNLAMSYGDAQQEWITGRGSLGMSMMSRAQAGWTAQNVGYAPASIFILGAESKYKKLMGANFSSREFFQAGVVDALQPATIAALDATLKSWAVSKGYDPS